MAFMKVQDGIINIGMITAIGIEADGWRVRVAGECYFLSNPDDMAKLEAIDRFLRIEGGEYIINVDQISSIGIEADGWRVWVAGEGYFLSDPDEIVQLEKLLGV